MLHFIECCTGHFFFAGKLQRNACGRRPRKGENATKEVLETATRRYLAAVAHKQATLPFHGKIEGAASNIKPIIDLFPNWNVTDADGMWCAAFVYYCCIKAGFEIPYSPDTCMTCSLAGCGGWEEFALGDKRIEYCGRAENRLPAPGDIVLYDRVFIGQEHDHIGIVLSADENSITAAEGNIRGSNTSGIITRLRDEHIRGYIRIPDGFRYG